MLIYCSFFKKRLLLLTYHEDARQPETVLSIVKFSKVLDFSNSFATDGPLYTLPSDPTISPSKMPLKLF